MLERRGTRRRITLGADKAYDVDEFVETVRDRVVTLPPIAGDGRLSKTGKRRRIKITGGLAKTRHRELDRVGWVFTLTAVAYNLVRLPKLIAKAPT